MRTKVDMSEWSRRQTLNFFSFKTTSSLPFSSANEVVLKISVLQLTRSHDLDSPTSPVFNVVFLTFDSYSYDVLMLEKKLSH